MNLEVLYSSLEKRMDEIEKKQAKFITWPWFITTLIAIAGLQITLILYLVAEVKEVQNKQSVLTSMVYEINGKLQPFEFIKE